MSANIKRINAWSVIVWAGAAGLLALPAIAMRFTHEVQWTGFDFLVWGSMLAFAAGAFEIAMRVSRSWMYRAAAALGIFTGFFLAWAGGAVGLIGDEDNAANLMYVGVLAVAIVGALFARFRAVGMARAMTAAAIAQATVGAIALIGRMGPPLELLGITALYVVLWFGSSVLFRGAARG